MGLRPPAQETPAAAPVAALSPRELEVLRLAAQGASQREIASTLNLSPNTVKTYLGHVTKKLGAASRAQALHLAAEQDLVPDIRPPWRREPLVAQVLRMATEQGLVRTGPLSSRNGRVRRRRSA